MTRWLRIPAGVAVLLAGFAAGIVVATVARWQVRDAGFFQAVKAMNAPGYGAVWHAGGTEKKSLSVDAERAPVRLKAVAKAYGYHAVPFGDVDVFVKEPNTSGTASEQISAARSLLDSYGGVKALRDYNTGVERQGQRLVASMSVGKSPFSDLTPAQQQQALAFARGAALRHDAVDIVSVLQKD